MMVRLFIVIPLLLGFNDPGGNDITCLQPGQDLGIRDILQADFDRSQGGDTVDHHENRKLTRVQLV